MDSEATRSASTAGMVLVWALGAMLLLVVAGKGAENLFDERCWDLAVQAIDAGIDVPTMPGRPDVPASDDPPLIRYLPPRAGCALEGGPELTWIAFPTGFTAIVTAVGVVWTAVMTEAVAMASGDKRIGWFEGWGLAIPIVGLALVLASSIVLSRAGLTDPWDPNPERWFGVTAVFYGLMLLATCAIVGRRQTKTGANRRHTFLRLGLRGWAWTALTLGALVGLGLL